MPQEDALKKGCRLPVEVLRHIVRYLVPVERESDPFLREREAKITRELAKFVAETGYMGTLEELSAKAEENVARHKETYGSARPQSWEEWGMQSRPTLEALSRTSRTFYEIVSPFLWETVDLQSKSTYDLLYLHEVILPRHGSHIRSVLHIEPYNFSPRSHIPPYILDSLNLPRPSNSYSFESTTLDVSKGLDSQRVDVRLLGGVVLPIPPEEDEAKENAEASYYRAMKDLGTKRYDVLDQRVKLISMLLRTLSRLDAVQIILDQEFIRMKEPFQTLTKVFEGPLGDKIKSLSLLSSEEEQIGRYNPDEPENYVSTFPPRSAPSLEVEIARLVSLLPDLTSFTLKNSIIKRPIGHEARGESTELSPLRLTAAIQNLSKLEELEIDWRAGITPAFFEIQANDGTGREDRALWNCPLRKLSLEHSDLTESEKAVAFLTRFPALESLKWCPGAWDEDWVSDKDIRYPSLPLSRLTRLSFPAGSCHVPLIVDVFGNAPLENLEFSDRVEVEGLLPFLDIHISTLKTIKFYRDAYTREWSRKMRLDWAMWSAETGVTVKFKFGDKDVTLSPEERREVVE